MSVETRALVNRLTGGDAAGDEPVTLLGIIVGRQPKRNEDLQVDRTEDRPDSLMAALPIRSALSEVLHEWDERILRGELRHELRLETSHVSRDTHGLYDLNEFERALQTEIDHLAWICLRPLQDLRYDELIQPVGRVRRPARGAAQQLSEHSEQWERWAPDYPIPGEILASIRDDDTDLYENRVARTLVNGALAHINRRLEQLNSHLRKNRDGQMVLLTGWHWRQMRLRSSFDAQDVDTVIEMLELAVAELERIATRLASLDRSMLFQETSSRGRIRSLRITNILRRDPRYRRIPPLWTLWSGIQDDDATRSKLLADPTLSRRGMDTLTEILAAKAIDWLGFSFDSVVGIYRKGHSSINISTSDGATILRINDTSGTRDIRLVGLASPLRSEDHPDPLLSARILDTWLSGHSDSVGALAILHPVDASDIVNVKHRDRNLLDHTGFDAIDASHTWAVIPATPLLVDSLERMTRFLRWHITAPNFKSNLVSIPCGDINRIDGKKFEGLTTCRLDEHNLVIIKPISTSDRQNLNEMAGRRPDGWLAEIERAEALYDTLLQCPIYPTHGKTDTQFKRRENDSFVCRCRGCRSEWGTNICGSCGSSIPFIRPGKAVPDGELPSDFFGGDLLSSLCEGAAAADVAPVVGGPDLRVLICPNCRTCSKSTRFTKCGRCYDSESSTP